MYIKTSFSSFFFSKNRIICNYISEVIFMKGCLVISLVILVMFFGTLDTSSSVIYGEDDDSYVDVGEITVSISGAVNNPGTFDVPSTWKLIDLINFVGLKASSDLSGVSLNDTLEDDESYEIDYLFYTKININTASLEELISLTGIGEVTANKIIAYRIEKYFTDITQLMDVGVSAKTFEEIKDDITV